MKANIATNNRSLDDSFTFSFESDTTPANTIELSTGDLGIEEMID